MLFGRALRGGGESFFGKLGLRLGFSDSGEILLFNGGDLAQVSLSLKKSHGFLMLVRFGEVW